MENCNTCYWADKCPQSTSECDDYTPLYDLDCLIEDTVDYALDLLARSAAYQELIDEMEGDA